MSPTPKTTCLREETRCGHFTQTNARSRNSAIAEVLASGESVGASDSTTIGTGAGSAIGTATGAGGVGLPTSTRLREAARAGSVAEAVETAGRISARVRAGATGDTRPAGCESSFTVSGETATKLRPCAFKSCKWRAVASINWWKSSDMPGILRNGIRGARRIFEARDRDPCP